ncbi:MAG: potassium transporter [Gammaproteobacteria bacterium]|nr:potassium transporter [Gammaproteobacteria bacterium]MYC24573.1 potassium transporter [Gammaproteobacteria bacterium]
MRFRVILGVLGTAILLFSPVFVVPLGVALIYGEPTVIQFMLCAGIAVCMGLGFFAIRERQALRARDAFLIVTLVYFTISALAALPLLLVPNIATSVPDALFESVSMVTTTGATVLVGLDEMPKSVLMYRQIVCWFGGMGIIVLVVAILPMLGIGGAQLIRAELSSDQNKLSVPLRVRETAETLWKIYVGMTVLCALSLWLAGMTPFDAIAHSFSTVAIGGFSTHDASIGYFDSTAIECVMIVFIVIAGCNFMLHYAAIHRPGRHSGRISHFFRTYASDAQIRFYFAALILTCTLICVKLALDNDYNGNLFREGIFHSVSFLTTAGFTTTDLNAWTSMAPVVLLYVSFIGACAGSTGGGFKVFRIVILFKQGVREIQQLLHPGAIFQARMNGKNISDRMLESTVGFVSVYVLCFAVLLGALMFVSSLDLITAFSAVAACLNNLGPGLGAVATNYHSLADLDKCILIFAMILGRLEIFTLLVLFAPRYWRR